MHTDRTNAHCDDIHDHPIPMDTLGHHSVEPSPEILHGPRPSEKRYGFLALHKNDYVVGIGLLLLVVMLWTSSSFLTQVCPALFISYINLHSYQYRTCMKAAIINHFCTIQTILLDLF